MWLMTDLLKEKKIPSRWLRNVGEKKSLPAGKWKPIWYASGFIRFLSRLEEKKDLFQLEFDRIRS